MQQKENVFENLTSGCYGNAFVRVTSNSTNLAMVRENGDLGIFKISFFELNGQSVDDLNAKNDMSKWIIYQKLQ